MFLITFKLSIPSDFWNFIHFPMLDCYHIAVIGCLSEKKNKQTHNKKKKPRPLFQSIENLLTNVTTQLYPTCDVVGSWCESAPLGFLCGNSYSISIKLNTERSHMSQRKNDELFFCFVTVWSGSGIELNWIELNWRDFPGGGAWACWMVYPGGDSWKVWATLGVYQCCLQRLKVFPLLSFSTPGLYMGWKPVA